MAQLPTIRDIAIDLYTEANIDYHTETLESVPQDDREGFDTVAISAEAIRYTTDAGNLMIQEVVGMDEDYNETTLDYLYSIEDAEGYTEEGGTDSAEELAEVIKKFMA